MPGFIHDKLEIKLLILYLSARMEEPASFETLLDLSLCDEGVGYFDFTECLHDLVDTDHLTRSPEGLYAITEKGLRNSGICEDALPLSVRMKCDKNLEGYNRAVRRKNQVRAAWEKRSNGTCSLRLILDDDVGNVMDLRLTVPGEDMARRFAERFEQTPERIFSRMMNVLLDDGQDAQDGK